MSFNERSEVSVEQTSRNAVSYAEDWIEYRHLVRKFVAIWLLYAPVVGSFAWGCDLLFRTFMPAFVAAIAWGLWFLMTGAEIGQFSCPRCGEYFAGGPGVGEVRLWVFARRCRHCGLRKFANSPDE